MNALLVICGLGVFSLIAEIVNIKKWLTTVILLGLVAATTIVAQDWGTSAFYYSEMLQFDNFSLAFTGLIIVASFFWFWMASDYINLQSHLTDRSALVLFVMIGAIIMVSFNNMAMLFLGIEILSISLYVLAGSRKDSLHSTEAAFKYFLMGAFATGFLLMGIALVYGATGSFYITKIAEYINIHGSELPAFFYAGVLLMLVGLAFKISAVPFHFWAPDVYEGSPTPITALMSTVVKIAAVAAFYRIFSFCFTSVQSTWLPVLQVVMILTLVLSNITAVYQSSVKRMLAYSSIGHVGYILLAFVAEDTEASGPIFYYLTAYAFASLTAFSILHALESSNENLTTENFNGLFKRNPLVAVGMTIALLSLAGIPPLPGFFGKYMVFALAIENGYVGLVIVAIVTSLIGVFYYFRVIIAMFFREPEHGDFNISVSLKIMLLILIVISFAFSIFPDSILSVIR